MGKMVRLIEALDSERARNGLANAPSLLGAQRSRFLLYTAPRTRLFAKLVSVVGRWFHFACDFGRGRCATAFCDIPLKRSVSPCQSILRQSSKPRG